VVGAHDLVPGVWEIVLQAMPGDGIWYELDIALAPAFAARADTVSGAVTLGASGDTALAATIEDLGIAKAWTERGLTDAIWRRELAVPSWALRAVVEVELTPEVWNTVTDYAISLFDRDDVRLGGGAMNYPYHRVEVELPEDRPADYAVSLELFPGFARPAPAPYDARIRVRFEGEPVVAAQRAAGPPAAQRLAPAGPARAVPEGWRRVLRLTTGAGPDDPLAAVRTWTASP
jgi:hypothetical protein